MSLGLRKRDRHVLEHPRISRVIAHGETVRGKGSVVIALSLLRQGFVEIVQPLRFVRPTSAASEEAVPETHRRGKIPKRQAPGNEWPDSNRVRSPAGRRRYALD